MKKPSMRYNKAELYVGILYWEIYYTFFDSTVYFKIVLAWFFSPHEYAAPGIYKSLFSRRF